MTRPETTLFMLTSVDGKISPGDTDILDVDKDFPTLTGIKEGLQQYYDIEKTTDLYSLNTGRVFAKIGINERDDLPTKLPVSFVVVDSRPHLTERGVRYLSRWAAKLIVATANPAHPAYDVRPHSDNVHIVPYSDFVDLPRLFEELGTKYGVQKLTIQSGGTLNAALIRQGLVDRVLLVIAPALIGGKSTPTLMDGVSLSSPQDLSQIKALRLIQATSLKDSYLLLEYRVNNS